MSGRNMYGCLPCPKCGSVYRFPTQDGRIVCDECGRTRNAIRTEGEFLGDNDAFDEAPEQQEGGDAAATDSLVQ